MIKVGIIGDIFKEDQLYQTLYSLKEVEVTGVYCPGKDFKSSRLKSYHNPIELLEVSDAIWIYSNEGISNDFIRLMIRKSKHIFFRHVPDIQLQDAKEILELHKEAGTVAQVFNRLLFVRPGITHEITPGAKIVNLQVVASGKEGHIFSDIIDSLVFLSRIENSAAKHSEIFGLQRGVSYSTVSIRINYSNGSVHNILISNEDIKTEIQVFQKSRFLQYSLPDANEESQSIQQYEIAAFQNFFLGIHNKQTESISFEDFYHSLKTYQEIKEKLNSSGIES